MAKKSQSTRLTTQHKKSQGVVGIFGGEAKLHDLTVGEISNLVVAQLEEEYPQLTFRFRKCIRKEEINVALKKIDSELVAEAKHQGKDIENIKKGIQVGTADNQDLMAAGNAIERSHKNISEIANFMLSESHFPYVLFLEGSNFLTETISVERPDGRIVTLEYNSGMLNRLDRLTSANYGMPINTNLCENKFLRHKDKTIMLQATSIYTQGNGEKWNNKEMFDIMIEIAKTSLKMLGSDLFRQITKK